MTVPKYHYLDHDTDWVHEEPPDQDQWYTVFEAEDVRLIWCFVTQWNEEELAKNIEVRWTCDSNIYLLQDFTNSGDEKYVFRVPYPGEGGTAGLGCETIIRTAAYYTDKRAQSFKVEVRITSIPGTSQTLDCMCVRETLEVT